MDTAQDLIVLTYVDYVRFKRDCKSAGFDLCYMAQAEQPIRLDWSLDVLHNPEFLQQVAKRRPVDPCYRIASVRLLKKGTWFRPDQYSVTFHAVGVMRDAAFQGYLADNQITGSAQAPRALLQPA